MNIKFVKANQNIPRFSNLKTGQTFIRAEEMNDLQRETFEDCNLYMKVQTHLGASVCVNLSRGNEFIFSDKNEELILVEANTEVAIIAK